MKREDALSLLKKYGASKPVLDHITAVTAYAVEIASKKDCDRELVEAGALLHDIGRTRSHNIDHAVVGAAILRNEGVDEHVVKIVERHIGAGLTAEDAAYLGLPPADYIPKTIEEKIVGHADNLIGSTERISINEAIKVARERWSPGAAERLIQFHFDVFKPEEVTLSEDIYADRERALRDIGRYVERELKDKDVLLKIELDGSRCKVLLYGGGSDAARKLLTEKAGIPHRVKEGTVCTGTIRHVGEDGITIGIGHGYKITPDALSSSFNDGSVMGIARQYGLIEGLPVEITVNAGHTATLTSRQVKHLKDVADTKKTVIIVTGIVRGRLKDVLKEHGINKQVSKIQQLGILSHALIAKKSVSGHRLAGKISKSLPEGAKATLLIKKP